MPMDGDAIYKNFWDEAHGTGDYEHAQDTITKANHLIGEVGDEVHQHAADLESYWKGDAADAAKQGLGPIAYESQYSRDRTDKAWDMLCQQSLDFHDKKNTVQKMPDKPGGLWDDIKGAATGGMTTYVEAKNYNDTGMANVKAMNDWTSATNTRTGSLPPVPPSQMHEKGGSVPTVQTHGNVGDTNTDSSNVSSPSGTSPAATSSAPSSSSGAASSTAAPSVQSAPQHSSASSASPSYSSHGSTAAPDVKSPSYTSHTSSPSESTPAAASAVPDVKAPSSEPEYTPHATPSDSYKDYEPGNYGGTSAAGFDAAPLSPTELGGGSSAFVPTTPTSPISSNTPGTYTGLGLTSGVPLAEEPGLGGATGRTTGNIGTGRTPGEFESGRPGAPGSGGRSGVAEPTARGGAGAASEGAGGRTAGTAGRPGTTGPMGTGAGRGKKDDKEHQRKYVATEQLDDGLDSEETDQGTLTRDAEGNVVPPDVIGEQPNKPAATADGDAKPAKPEGLTGRPKTAPKEAPEPITAKPEAPKPSYGGYRGTGA